MHCASAQRPLGGVGAFIDAEVPNLYRDARAWGRRHSGFLHRGETATDANPLVSAAQTSAEKSLIQGRVKYSHALQHGGMSPRAWLQLCRTGRSASGLDHDNGMIRVVRSPWASPCPGPGV